jgi:hypothetical protein
VTDFIRSNSLFSIAMNRPKPFPVNDRITTSAGTVPEHSIAAVFGFAAAIVGAFAWSGATAVFGAWALVAAPGLGWLVAWSCRYGGGRTSAGIRAMGWLLPVVSAFLGLVALSTFTALLGSPDAGVDPRTVVEGCRALFAAPPWLGSLAVLFVLAGVPRALRETDVPVVASRSTTASGPDLRVTARSETFAPSADPTPESRAA